MERPEFNPLSTPNPNNSTTNNLAWLVHLPVLVWQTNAELVVENIIGALVNEFGIDTSTIIQKTVWQLEEEEIEGANNNWIFSAQSHADALLGNDFYSIVNHKDKFYRLQITALKKENKLTGTAGMLTYINLGQPHDINIDSNSDSTNDAIIYKCADLLPSPTLIFSAANNKIQVANDAFLKSFKYDKNKIINKSIGILISTIDLSQIRSRTRRRGVIRTFEMKMKRKKKGKFFWVKMAVQMMQIANKEHYLLQFADITKSRQNEDKWRSLIKFAPDYVLHVDLGGNIQYINRTPNETSISEMMGRNVYEFITIKERSKLEETFEQVFESKGIGRFESLFYNYVTKSRTTWLSIRIAPMVTDDEVTGFALIASDITKAKQNQEQLSQSESKNKALLDTIPDQIFLLSEDGTILDYKADQQDYYDLKNPINKKIGDLFSFMVSDKIEQTIQKTLLTQKSQSIQYNYLTNANELLHLEARTNLSTQGKVLMIVRNITEQKYNEEVIIKNRQEYKQLLNNIDEIVYAVGINPNTGTYQLTFVSEHLQSVLNYPLDFFDKGFIPWMRVIHSEDRRRVLETMQQAVLGQTKISRSFRILHHTEKRYLWLEERINPQVDNVGNLIGFLGVARDITQEKIAKEEKQKLISLIGSSHEFIGLTDKDGIIKFINEAGKKLLGVEDKVLLENQKEEQPIGINILDYFTRSSQEKIRLEVFQFPRHESWETELRIINRRKYMPLDVAVSFFPIKLNETHEATSIAVVMRDISERKRSERKIKQSEQKYRTLIDTMREGIIVLNSKDEIVYVNERILELLGHVQGELIGKTIDSLLFSTEIDEESHAMLQKRVKTIPEQYELQLRRKSGDSLWAWVSSNPIKADHVESLGTILAVADVNSLKTAQHEIVSVNKEMEQLLYRASHDLKGPISSVEGVLNLFRIEKKNDLVVQQYTDMIEISTKQLSNLIKDLTKVSSIKQGKLNVKYIDFEQLINSIIATFSFYENFQNIDFRVQVLCKKEFRTDEGLLYTIIQNFIENGIKYSKRNFDNSLIQITVKDIPKGIEIEFLDNGIGIPKKSQETIFDMFIRASDQAKGSGLGLYIVHNAIKKLQGTIQLQSEEYAGSIFTVQLPCIDL
ncbi:PAS domain S-box [Bernardetia litoralis DSM 6794]|uniref:histidine kinase n=1 Tax=Bernardetia litoralis (strain ATCC 23117 / DSM 6794 / NBRC 15988 / NCIMB 1366 / Fx l1 / Sio-4) TaxID=880071 RepID=I4ANS7_BERLS|nr:PAS domain S-box protein [Bernardetia litoralis]AFM05612.1 PAS domain S-box [Bernardetia litoralis DSM 6794]